MTTPGDPNEPRQGQDPSRSDEGGQPPEQPSEQPPEGQRPHEPTWWNEGREPENEQPEPAPGEEPIEPRPPVVPRPEGPPTDQPRPTGEPRHPDLPTSPETPEPTGSEEETQAFPVPGATPSYPGWGGTPQEGQTGKQPPSRYEGGPEGPEPEERAGPPYRGQEQEPTVPGTTPSSPYGGPPGYPPPPPPGSPFGAPGPPYGQYPQPPPGSGLATASLVLGVASPFLVFVCFTGVITAILSIVFGGVALAKRAGKGRAIAGIVISVLSLILFAIVATWFWNVVQQCAHLPSQLADRCFEERFPWMGGSR